MELAARTTASAACVVAFPRISTARAADATARSNACVAAFPALLALPEAATGDEEGGTDGAMVTGAGVGVAAGCGAAVVRLTVGVRTDRRAAAARIAASAACDAARAYTSADRDAPVSACASRWEARMLSVSAAAGRGDATGAAGVETEAGRGSTGNGRDTGADCGVSGADGAAWGTRIERNTASARIAASAATDTARANPSTSRDAPVRAAPNR
jgi:hypothetical protein